MINITITEEAKAHLKKLLQNKENKGKELYLTALDPETPYAEAGLSFVEIGPEHTEDFIVGFEDFRVFIDRKSKDYIEGATIELKEENLQKELLVDAPNLKPLMAFDENASLFERVHWIIETEINPSLASHGGMVQLIEITDDGIVKLQFGGGCQGCGMADMTLTQGITATLMERFPEINDIEDVTDHDAGSSPFM
jgi:Fe/S biogenesis protein NfuA